MVMIVCHRKGVVTQGFCGNCTDWENAKAGNPWGNSAATCANFGHFIGRKGLPDPTKKELAEIRYHARRVDREC